MAKIWSRSNGWFGDQAATVIYLVASEQDNHWWFMKWNYSKLRLLF